MVLDSWLDSVYPNDRWKWFHYFPCVQKKAAPHQNQRLHCLTCSGGFLCWSERRSFLLHLRHYRRLRLVYRTPSFMDTWYKMVVWLRICDEFVQLSTRTLHRHRETFQISNCYDQMSVVKMIIFSWTFPIILL